MAHFLVIDESIHPSGIYILRRAGSVEVIPHSMVEDKILQKLTSVDGILVRRGKMTDQIIDAAPRLKVIARWGGPLGPDRDHAADLTACRVC